MSNREILTFLKNRMHDVAIVINRYDTFPESREGQSSVNITVSVVTVQCGALLSAMSEPAYYRFSNGIPINDPNNHLIDRIREATDRLWKKLPPHSDTALSIVKSMEELFDAIGTRARMARESSTPAT